MAEKPETEVQQENIEELNKKDKKKVEKLQDEIEKLKADVEHWKNEYYRAYADTKNLRNNLERDHREALKYRGEGFIEALLPVLDSFHMALKNEPTDPALKNYLVGFQYIYKNFVNALSEEGVTEISPEVGKPFDANLMSAVDTVEGETDNLVTMVYAKGYKLHDRMIRPANVQVSMKPKKEDNKTTENEKLDA